MKYTTIQVGYCINLANRKDRLEEVIQEVVKAGIPFPILRWAATPNPVGHQGCIRSHARLAERISHLTTKKPVLVLEDDVVFLEPYPTVKRILGELDALTSGAWAILYLGATLTIPVTRVSPSLFRLKGGLTTHAIIYNPASGVTDFIAKNVGGDFVDVFFLTEVQERFACYLTDPLIATQRPGISDTIGAYTDYTIIESSYAKFTNKL